MSHQGDPFQKITDLQKSNFFNGIPLRVKSILCKSKDSLFSVTPTVVHSSHKIYFAFESEQNIFKINDDLVCQAAPEGESTFIFKSYIRKDKNGYYLECTDDVFQVQRRENFRMKFPTSLSSKATVKCKDQKVIGKIYDLSARGTRIALQQPIDDIFLSETLPIELSIVGNPTIQITAIIKHSTQSFEFLNDKKITVFYYGMQFLNISSENEKTLIRVNMELYRNFLSKVG